MRRMIALVAALATIWFVAEDLTVQFGPVKVAGEPAYTVAQAIPIQAIPVSRGDEYRELSQKTTLSAAEEYLENHREAWKLQKHHEFRLEETRLPIGTRVKYSVWQDGVFIPGLTISLLVDKNFEVKELEKHYEPLEKLGWKEIAHLKPEEVLGRHGNFSGEPAASATILHIVPGSLVPELAYVMPVKDKTTRRSGQIVFRAKDGEILGKSFSRSEF